MTPVLSCSQTHLPAGCYARVMKLDALGSDIIRVTRFAVTAVRPMKRPVSHSYVGLVFHVGGQVRVEHHGEFELRPGHVHLIPAGDAHRVLTASQAEVWGLAFCRTCLPQERFQDLLEPLDRVRRGAAPYVELPADRQGHVLTLLREIEREQSLSIGAMPVVLESLVGLLLAEIVRAGPRESSADRAPSMVGDVLSLIEARCLGPLTLNEVAESVRRSPAHVTTAVKAATGRTVVQWIIEGRLAESRRRLLDTDEFVDVIAERVGYADPSHFVRMFRRRHGATPAAWRSRERERRRLLRAT
jgi:AraC-like DNA-binding protein